MISVDLHRMRQYTPWLVFATSLFILTSTILLTLFLPTPGMALDEKPGRTSSLWGNYQSPQRCRECHQTEFEEMDGSHHSKGGQILASLDNLLGEVVGGPEAVNAGCRQCHGAIIEIETEEGRIRSGARGEARGGRIGHGGDQSGCGEQHRCQQTLLNH